MSDRPTDAAIKQFNLAEQEARGAVASLMQMPDPGTSGPFNVHMAQTVQAMAKGMTQLSVALHAVYVLLEEVQRTVKQQQLGSR
jgi:hypothetical protein